MPFILISSELEESSDLINEKIFLYFSSFSEELKLINESFVFLFISLIYVVNNSFNSFFSSSVDFSIILNICFIEGLLFLGILLIEFLDVECFEKSLFFPEDDNFL